MVACERYGSGRALGKQAGLCVLAQAKVSESAELKQAGVVRGQLLH